MAKRDESSRSPSPRSASRGVILPPASDESLKQGLSLWLPSQDAKRLAVLAREADVGNADMLSRIIAFFFKARQNGA